MRGVNDGVLRRMLSGRALPPGMRLRGQVTLFFAVGLVMLLFLALLFLTMQGGKKDREQENAVIELANNAVLNEYLTSCLDTVVNDELRKLGQSGALPDDTAGYPYALVGTGPGERKVLFGITKNRDCVDPTHCTLLPYAHSAPRYPDTTSTNNFNIALSDVNLATGEPFHPFMDGYFGDVHFPAVCNPRGPNAPNGPNACKYYYLSQGSTRIVNPPGTTGPSTQDQLSRHITSRVESCADLALFSRATGSNIVSVAPPTVNITFTQDGVLAQFDYPVTLRGNTETTTLPFYRTYDIRYLAIAQYAFDLAREETRNITFNISRKDEYQRLSSYREGFTVGKSADVAFSSPSPSAALSSSKADLITVIDARSRIDNQAYTFSFLAEHRPPALTVLSTINDCDDAAPGTIAASPSELPLIVTVDDGSPGNCSVKDSDGQRDWQEALS